MQEPINTALVLTKKLPWNFFHYYYSRCVLPLLVWDTDMIDTSCHCQIFIYFGMVVCASTDEAWILVCVILEEPC